MNKGDKILAIKDICLMNNELSETGDIKIKKGTILELYRYEEYNGTVIIGVKHECMEMIITFKSTERLNNFCGVINEIV